MSHLTDLRKYRREFSMIKKENASSVGVIVTSIFATSCCIGPALFVVFGTSTGFLGKLTFLSPFRPYFFIIAPMLLGYSFWSLYLKKPECEKCVENKRSRTIARSLFWLGLGAVIFSFIFQRLVLTISNLLEKV
jgi:mercuric ion transport protein